MRALRTATLVALVAGQASAWLAGVLPLPALLLALVVTPACAAGSTRLPAGAARHLASGVVLLLAVLAVPRLVAGGGPDGLRGTLGPLLVGISAVQPLTWQHRRDVQTGIAGAFGLLVLGASFAPDVLVGVPLLVGWVAALTAGLLASGSRLHESADVVLPGPRSGVLAPAALAAALGLALFLLVPLPEDAGLASRLNAAVQAAAGGGRGAPGAYTGERVDLRVRGELSDRPLLEVAADSPALWRGGVYTDWDGAGWTSSADRRRLADGRVAAPTGELRTDRVRVERRAGGVVFAPGPVVQVALPGSAVVDDHGVVLGWTSPGYDVVSQVVAPTDAELDAAVGEDVNDPQWTALPAAVPARVRDLGRQLAAGTSSRAEHVRRVEGWLAANASYRLDSPVPGPGEDAVDRFLFVDRVGFCEQFAAAEVLLLRAAGVPARFVTGLAYGVPAGDDRRTFREKDLHAWVEVHHPGVGWVASDPTPPSTQLASAPWRARAAAQLTVLLRRAEAVPGGRPALAAGVLTATALVPLLVLTGRRGRRRSAESTVVPSTPGGPALQAFRRFDDRLGPERRRPAETLAELGSRLRVDPALDDALRAVERECYGAPGRSAEPEVLAALLDAPAPGAPRD